jgi:two-component system LytT family response regulator
MDVIEKDLSRMKPIRTVIVDDEPLGSRLLKRMIGRHPDFTVVARHADPIAALAEIEREPPDALFLDIRMPELDGFALLDRLEPARRPLVVFVTAYDQFALRAFEVAAVDYLMKPFDEERLAATLQRVRARLTRVEDPPGAILGRLLEELQQHRSRTADSPRYLTVWTPGDQRARLLPLEEVWRITAMGKLLEVETSSGTFELSGPLKEREALLDPRRFIRINRSTIVNVEQIQEVQRWFRGDYLVVLKSGERFRSSRGSRDELEALLQLKT